MSTSGSVTKWINRLKAGDPEAARRLWERLLPAAGRAGPGKLEGSSRRAADEEDVALSAFGSLCRGAEGGRFPHLLDRDSLWQLLVAITSHKVLDLRRREGRQKRGGGRVLDEAALADSDEVGLEQVLGRDPTPEFAAQLAEEFERLLARLENLPPPFPRPRASRHGKRLAASSITHRTGCGSGTCIRARRVPRSSGGNRRCRATTAPPSGSPSVPTATPSPRPARTVR